MTSPYKIERDYWPDLPIEARRWANRFWWATERGNMETLHALCVEALADGVRPGDVETLYNKIKAEVAYERDFYKRDQGSITAQRHPKFSELDYGWSQPVRSTNKRNEIDKNYYTRDHFTAKRRRYK